MIIDISTLLGKVENGGANESGRLSASEFNLLVSAVRENQNDTVAVANQAKDNAGIIEKMSPKVNKNTEDIKELASKVETNINDIHKTASEVTALISDLQEVPDFAEIRLCGQPLKLFGHGAPSTDSVPDNWIQMKDGGYDWNGVPSALGQEYINVDSSTGGHYIAIRDSAMKLKWYNC